MLYEDCRSSRTKTQLSGRLHTLLAVERDCGFGAGPTIERSLRRKGRRKGTVFAFFGVADGDGVCQKSFDY